MTTIEPDMRPLCNVLNSIPGVETQWSCEGHPTRVGGNFAPYVMFFADEATARCINALLQHSRRTGDLYFNWWVRGSFSDEGIWRYSIENNDVRLARGKLFRLIPRWNKSQMRVELARMSLIIEQGISQVVII